MKFRYIIKTFLHYIKANLLVALGVAISTMVLSGSLIIGDSVRHSLKQATFYRLGESTHLVSAVERYFRQEMAEELEVDNSSIKGIPLLLLEGIAVAEGGQKRANKIQVVGVDSDFEKVSGSKLFSGLTNNEIAVSRNLAERLGIGEGDNILLRIKKASLIPLNAPFVSEEEPDVSMRASVKKIVDKDELGRFNLRNSQTAPFNVFLSIERLNSLMEFEGKANQILVISDLSVAEITESVHNSLTPVDAGLIVKKVEKTGEIEISTERVFLEKKISETLNKLPHAQPILSYFVNEISFQNNSIPYSFVSSVQNEYLSVNEVVLNQWAATDLKVKKGETITLRYFEIGPLRNLVNNEIQLIVKDIVPMDAQWCDPERIPHLPGLSDAGHCREWEAGVPIDLDAIRDSDEEYWDDYKGTPKAFISHENATKLWANRFGDNTSFRIPENEFKIEQFKKLFAENIGPEDLGISIEPIRDKGIAAAENGTDFSGLFIGLSFFILIASVILTSLLFLLNLEARSAQVSLLTALGFKQNSVRKLYLFEGAVISLAGGLIGLVISVFYTKLIFKILNTLWFEIVRTNVLEIKIIASSLIVGLLVSILVSVIAIYVSVTRFQKRKKVDLQGQPDFRSSRNSTWIRKMLGYLVMVAAVVILITQLLAKQLNSSMFFLSGALLLIGFISFYNSRLVSIKNSLRTDIRMGKLAQLNLVRNKARSLTVVILFALGTFMVVSTGSNKLDLFTDADEKSSGTGGFLYFAESTMPVLFNINDENKRAEQGIYESFEAVQFRQIGGDDASCLNLNKVVQPSVLGVDPESLQGRFSFATQLKELKDNDPWLFLNEERKDGTIPAIADQTVIQWGLGMKVGDILLYQNELGDTIRLKLIAGTTPSVFQGYVIISNKFFLGNYPTSSGSNLFLINGDNKNREAIGEELTSVFRDYGWEMETTVKRLIEFYSVTNTYLSIFLALGALGLILGTIGLAVILARTILERRREIAVMKAVGFHTISVFKILFKEYLYLLLVGVLIGFSASVIATLPALVSTNTDASFSTVTLVVAIIIVNGILWIGGLSWFSIHDKILVQELRTE